MALVVIMALMLVGRWGFIRHPSAVPHRLRAAPGQRNMKLLLVTSVLIHRASVHRIRSIPGSYASQRTGAVPANFALFVESLIPAV